MTLTSFAYLFFMPVVFVLYWLIFKRDKNWQNAFLLLSSLVFYAWWDWRFMALLLFTAGTSFFFGKLIAESDSEKRRKGLLVTVLLLNLGILVYYKYLGFFIQSFVDMFSLAGIELSVSTLKIVLPVGISFYTFAALSYDIDIYQRKVEPTKDWLAYFAFVTFFPSLLSGPISRATKQLPQYFQKREFSYDISIAACRMILWGAFIKLCVADTLGVYIDTIYANMDKHNGTTLFLAQLLYTVQIYADFAGYSFMAIGSGKLLGINLLDNFNRPYFAKTVTEFWRRWHISLTTWFRDYIYFPMGGNRVSKLRWMFNTVVVFVISGLWHGAAYTFLIWGALHGIVMVIERQLYGDKIKNLTSKFTLPNLVRMFITFNLVSIAWIFFRQNSVADAVHVIKSMFTDFGKPYINMQMFAPAFIALAIMWLKDLADEYGWRLKLLNNDSMAVRFVTALLLICYILLCGELDGNLFIYFQF